MFALAVPAQGPGLARRGIAEEQLFPPCVTWPWTEAGGLSLGLQLSADPWLNLSQV